jgi:hypothetical protein
MDFPRWWRFFFLKKIIWLYIDGFTYIPNLDEPGLIIEDFRKLQITSTKLQINLKFQYPMTKTFNTAVP